MCVGNRWEEVSLPGARCDMAGKGMPMVSMLGASRVVRHVHVHSMQGQLWSLSR